MGARIVTSERTLHVDVRVGETLLIGSARVRLEHKSGQRARLSVTAPAGVRVETSRGVTAAEIARKGVHAL